MPELPEVETVVRTLRPHVAGKKILKLRTVGTPCLVPESRSLEEAEGRVVAEASRRGKFIVLRLTKDRESDLFLVIHLRMTGRLMAYDRPESAEENWTENLCGRHARVFGLLGVSCADCALVFSDARKFGRLFLGTEKERADWSSWARLGPEPLDMGEEAFAGAITGRRAVKSVLLDQTVLAGVGNIYADESLFAAHIRPDAEAGSLSKARLRRLYRELKRLLLLSIEQCGSSIRDYQDADGNVGAFQNTFAVYGRGGDMCRNCRGKLKRVVLGGRGTVFCPRCQKT